MHILRDAKVARQKKKKVAFKPPGKDCRQRIEERMRSDGSEARSVGRKKTE